MYRSTLRSIATNVIKTVIPGNWCVRVVCTQPQNCYIWSLNRFTILQKFWEAEYAARVRFWSVLCEAWCSGEVDPLLSYFTDDVWFHLSGHVSTQNNRHQWADNPVLLHEVLWHDIKTGAWCAVSAAIIIWSIFFMDTVSLEWYIGKIMSPFFKFKSWIEWMQVLPARLFQSPVQQMIQSSPYLTFLGTAYLVVISWPARSPGQTPCDN